MEKSLIIKLITHSSHKYGLGHLSRSNILKEQFQELTYEVEQLSIETELELIECLESPALTKSIYVIDLDPRFWEKATKTFRIFICRENFAHKPKIFIFDDPNLTIRKMLDLDHSIVFFVNPYQDNLATNPLNILAGLDFFPFPKHLRTIRNEYLNILDSNQIAITCGGSDPFQLTELYLDLLDSYRLNTLNVSVFIGPLFKPSHIKSLRRASKLAFHRIQLKTHEEYANDLFRKTTLALTSGGLTRYELAFCGIPFFSFSFEAIQESTSEMFSSAGACIYLGHYNQSFSDLRANFLYNLERLLLDEDKRKQMAEKGRQLFQDNSFSLVKKMVALSCDGD